MFSFIRMQVKPEKIALDAHINIVTNLYLLVCCKYIPTSIEPTTPPPMKTAPNLLFLNVNTIEFKTNNLD